MPKVIVLGAGVCGLAAGMLLARDGHDVTVLERDPEPVPESAEAAWETWARGGVVQFRQAHFLQARGHEVLAQELPDVRDALAAEGACRLEPLDRIPPSIADRAPRPGDERLATLTARRPTIEHAFARAAERRPRMEVRRGASARGLTSRVVDGTPHVTGVLTDAGEALTADLVVDAMGRGSALPRWLRDCGAVRVSEEAEDSGFLYYTRYFRAPDGRVPEFRAALLTPVGSFSVLTLPGDHGTWSVTLYLSAGDRPLKRLRLPEKWTALLRACPLHAHWLEGEPITGVLAMGGVIDRYRRLVVDGRPVATGIATVADSWACTNPSLGRGIALGLVHAARLRDVFRAHGDDPPAFSAAWDDVTERELTPWYRATVAVDRARLAEIGALRAGLPAPAPAEPAAVVRAALAVASLHDPDAFRAALEITGCLALPEEVFARSGLVERVLEIARDRDASRPVGPDRDELLRLVA